MSMSMRIFLILTTHTHTFCLLVFKCVSKTYLIPAKIDGSRAFWPVFSPQNTHDQPGEYHHCSDHICDNLWRNDDNYSEEDDNEGKDEHRASIISYIHHNCK